MFDTLTVAAKLGYGVKPYMRAALGEPRAATTYSQFAGVDSTRAIA